MPLLAELQEAIGELRGVVFGQSCAQARGSCGPFVVPLPLTGSSQACRTAKFVHCVCCICSIGGTGTPNHPGDAPGQSSSGAAGLPNQDVSLPSSSTDQTAPKGTGKCMWHLGGCWRAGTSPRGPLTLPPTTPALQFCASADVISNSNSPRPCHMQLSYYALTPVPLQTAPEHCLVLSRVTFIPLLLLLCQVSSCPWWVAAAPTAAASHTTAAMPAPAASSTTAPTAGAGSPAAT